MISAEPTHQIAVRGAEVKASVLAALQLVEDARYLGPDSRHRRERMRQVAERTVASRRLARDQRVS